jgi:ADP-ribosylglycohydrolase
MLGAIAGDVIGSVHEHARTKTKDFPLLTPESRFTDDTVLTVAIADCLLHGRDYGRASRLLPRLPERRLRRHLLPLGQLPPP